MTRTTYRGVRLAVKAMPGRGLEYLVNGERWGVWNERDAPAAIEQMKRYVDAAAARPGSSPTFEPRETA